MFSISEKRSISDSIQKILRNTKDPELPKHEINFHLHVEGAQNWSWADIKNNSQVIKPTINPWNERKK